MTMQTCFSRVTELTIVDQDVQAPHELHLQPLSWAIKPIALCKLSKSC